MMIEIGINLTITIIVSVVAYCLFGIWWEVAKR